MPDDKKPIDTAGQQATPLTLRKAEDVSIAMIMQSAAAIMQREDPMAASHKPQARVEFLLGVIARRLGRIEDRMSSDVACGFKRSSSGPALS